MSSATLAPEIESQPGTSNNKCSTSAVTDFVGELSSIVDDTIEEINIVNSRTQLLALNARIEAARAGKAGVTFTVVAEEMKLLGSKTADIAKNMANQTKTTIDGLVDLIGSSVRGGRLSDMALVNIDLVDRNLYERTCDVRWWATDSSLVDALTQKNPDAFQYASHRLGVILSAYTVYHDLVLCDLKGRIVANGRPDLYHSAGKVVDQDEWFLEAARTSNGDQYGFQTAHRSGLVNDQSVLIYSCGVREHGKSNGRLLGVLGILFNWESFAQTIMEQTPLAEEERATTRCLLCDDSCRVLADSWGRQLQEDIVLPDAEQLLKQKKSYTMARLGDHKTCIAHALAPGFETYTTGWHSLIIQQTDC